ncbi:MAG TPA: hypothetical protein DCL18_04745 [Prevotella sp.]|nr:hypothetical protein [Prevotella sp.]
MPGIQLFTISMPGGWVGNDRKTAMWPHLYIITMCKGGWGEDGGGDVRYVLVLQWQWGKDKGLESSCENSSPNHGYVRDGQADNVNLLFFFIST